ncbi:hypothetical protein HY570_02270 [Candidatus Micrarchaeota archaeon]|nr:hypothetical protein [Candidatus Micrarchaeota archaeon]
MVAFGQGYEWVLSWTQTSLLAVMTVFFIVAVLHMLGTLIDNQRIKMWAKSEFLQALASALIILWLVVLANAFAAIVSQTTGVAGSPLDVVRADINSKITSLTSMYSTAKAQNDHFSVLEWDCITIIGLQTCHPEVHTDVEFWRTVGYKITQLRVALNAELLLLDFVERGMLGLFLPLGILLRMAPITRGLGGLMIASAIGMYFIFPIFYVLGSSATAVGGGSTGQQIGFDLAVLQIDVFFTPFIALVVAVVFIRAVGPILGGDTDMVLRGVSRML